MQSKQRWDRDKGGSIGEDDKFISSMSGEDSWRADLFVNEGGEPSSWNIAIDTTKKSRIDAKNVIIRDIPDTEDNHIIPSLHTKAGDIIKSD